MFLQSAQKKKSIGEVRKLKKRGRGTTGKKSKQRGRKILTKPESLKEKKAVDCICWLSKDSSWETAITGAISGGTHYTRNMGGFSDTCRNSFMYILKQGQRHKLAEYSHIMRYY